MGWDGVWWRGGGGYRDGGAGGSGGEGGGDDGDEGSSAVAAERREKKKLTSRVEGGGIDRRTIGAVWTGGVHDRQERPRPAAATKLTMATCREVVGLARSGDGGGADGQD